MRPDRTYCERHFLAVTVDAKRNGGSGSATTTDEKGEDADETAGTILVLAIEVFIFTTAFSSIFFVSKADSTGYLHLADLPKGAPSPIREISSAFVTHLVEQRRREGLQSVVTLFARAQSQYLFPGSVKNSAKHVQDDRGLVKWWCRVLNPLVAATEQGGGGEGEGDSLSWLRTHYDPIRGFLIVPGLDDRETQAFLPRVPPGTVSRWCLGHPLEEMSHYCREYDWVPPRCLIPRYPRRPQVALPRRARRRVGKVEAGHRRVEERQDAGASSGR